MKKAKIEHLQALREEMKAVARGERRAPSDASRPSFNSIEAVVRLLTPCRFAEGMDPGFSKPFPPEFPRLTAR